MEHLPTMFDASLVFLMKIAVWRYLMLFCSIVFNVDKTTLTPIIWQQTITNWKRTIINKHNIFQPGLGNRVKRIWWFPKMEVPPNHLFLFGIFHEINHPAIGIPPFQNISVCKPNPSATETFIKILVSEVQTKGYHDSIAASWYFLTPYMRVLAGGNMFSTELAMHITTWHSTLRLIPLTKLVMSLVISMGEVGFIHL